MLRNMSLVPFGKAAPVQSRPHVVRGMETVVKKEPIDPFPCDIPGVVVQGIMIASLMLKKIDGDNAPLAEEPGENTKQKRCASIGDQQEKSQAQNGQAFPPPLPCQPRVSGGHAVEVGPLALSHLSDGNEREHKKIHPVPFVANQSAPNTIFLGVIFSVVSVIVDRDDGNGRLAGCKCQCVIEGMVPKPRCENGTMNMVVFDHASDERKNAGGSE